MMNGLMAIKGKLLLVIGILAILGAGGAAVWYATGGDFDGGARAKAEAEAAEAKAKAAKAEEAKPELDLSGRLQAVKLVRVPAPLEGVLENLQVREGEEVTEGQLLATVKSDALNTEQEHAASEVESAQGRLTALEAQVIAARLEAQRTRSDADSSRNTLEAARKNNDRQALLWKEGATARKNFERAESEFKNATVESAAKDNLARQAEERVQTLARLIDETKKTLADRTAAWEATKADLNAAQVHSPVNGVVVRVTKQSGDPVDRTVIDLFQIASDLTLMEAVVQLNPEELKRVKPGQPAEVRVIESGNEAMTGMVRELKENEAFIEFKSGSEAVRPGLIAQVRIYLKDAVASKDAPSNKKK